MKNQLANFFEIIFKSDVFTIDGDIVTLKAGKSFDKIFVKNNVTVLDKPAVQSGNSYFQQSSKMVCPKLPTEQSGKYRSSNPVIIKLYYTDGSPLVWGSLDHPVRVQLNRQINHDILELSRKSIDSLL